MSGLYDNAMTSIPRKMTTSLFMAATKDQPLSPIHAPPSSPLIPLQQQKDFHECALTLTPPPDNPKQLDFSEDQGGYICIRALLQMFTQA